jgi:AcrR family transcriptional regulator
MNRTRSNTSETRQRIIETAERLFYAEGVRAVGIDRIIADAGVAKMSLYNHFASKDDLILAVLQHREQVFQADFDKACNKYARAGLGRLDAFFAALKDWFKSGGFRGCMFINSHVELANHDHAAAKFAVAHKERFHQMLRGILDETFGSKIAESIAPAVAILVEGPIIAAVMEQSSEPADVAHTATLALAAKAKKK